MQPTFKDSMSSTFYLVEPLCNLNQSTDFAKKKKKIGFFNSSGSSILHKRIHLDKVFQQNLHPKTSNSILTYFKAHNTFYKTELF